MRDAAESSYVVEYVGQRHCVSGTAGLNNLLAEKKALGWDMNEVVIYKRII